MSKIHHVSLHQIPNEDLRISTIQHSYFQAFQLCHISTSQHLRDKLSRANIFIAQLSKPTESHATSNKLVTQHSSVSSNGLACSYCEFCSSCQLCREHDMIVVLLPNELRMDPLLIDSVASCTGYQIEVKCEASFLSLTQF